MQSQNLSVGMKTRNQLRVIFILVFTFSTLFGLGQKVEVKANYLQGFHYTSNWDLFKGGSELMINYRNPVKDFIVNTGVSFRTIQWGNQLSISTGITKSFFGDRTEFGAEIQNGIALFYEKPLYSLNLGVKASYLFFKKEKLTLGVSGEIRFTSCPGYKNYSLIYSVWEIPLGLFIRF